jgi:hypothetical protein
MISLFGYSDDDLKIELKIENNGGLNLKQQKDFRLELEEVVRYAMEDRSRL